MRILATVLYSVYNFDMFSSLAHMGNPALVLRSKALDALLDEETFDRTVDVYVKQPHQDYPPTPMPL